MAELLERVKFSVETYQDALAGIMAVAHRHFEEMAEHKDKVPLAPKLQLYANADANGQLMALTGRLDGKVIAYYISFVTPSAHYDLMDSMSDMFWVDPDYRGHRIGEAMFKAAERFLRGRKVDQMFTETKTDHPAAGHILEQLGHEPRRLIYSKFLRE